MSTLQGGAGGIVTDGLVLHYDSANYKNFVTGSTNLYDLSSYKNDGIVSNSISYDFSNGGVFSFNGTNQSIIIPNNTALDTQTPTVEVWIKTNALSQNGFWFEKGTVNTQYSLFQEGGSVLWRQRTDGGLVQQIISSATYLNTTSWSQIVGTFRSGERKIYVNAIERNSDTQTGTIATNTGGMSIGVFGGYTGGGSPPRGYNYNGYLAIVRVYNRVLSATEILQNYNSVKKRFGL